MVVQTAFSENICLVLWTDSSLIIYCKLTSHDFEDSNNQIIVNILLFISGHIHECMLPLILSLKLFRYNIFNYDYSSSFLKSGTKLFRIQILFKVQPEYHIIFKCPLRVSIDNTVRGSRMAAVQWRAGVHDSIEAGGHTPPPPAVASGLVFVSGLSPW